VSPAVTDVARWVNTAGTWRVLVPATLALLLAVPEARSRWWLWVAVLIATPLLGEGWQELVARPRPQGPGLGFPSGHTTASATSAVVAIYLIERSRYCRMWRALAQTLAGLTALGVGLARVVLQAHWPADVVTGFALGSACASGVAWWDAAHPPAAPDTGLAIREG
jgi:undecaprenyl-diphosphatase